MYLSVVQESSKLIENYGLIIVQHCSVQYTSSMIYLTKFV